MAKTTTPEQQALRDKAVATLRTSGPMKAKALAASLGLPDARKLSMLLQWDPRVNFKEGKWTH